jgi:hypothetical protein
MMSGDIEVNKQPAGPSSETDRYMKDQVAALEDEDLLTSPALQKEPFLYFGFGINSYFSFLGYMILIFLIVLLLLIPSFLIFSRYSGMNFKNKEWKAEYTLGNLGSSSSHCINSPLSADNLIFSCRSGVI